MSARRNAPRSAHAQRGFLLNPFRFGGGGGGGGTPVELVKNNFDFSNGLKTFSDQGTLGLTWSGTAEISTSAPINGTASLITNTGSGMRSYASWVPGLDLGASDFSISLKANIDSGWAGSSLSILSAASQSPAADAFRLYFGGGGSGALIASVYTSAGTFTITGSTITQGVAHTIEIKRVGALLSLIVDGVTVATGAITGAVNTRGGGYLVIGSIDTSSGAIRGKFDDLLLKTL